MNQLIKPFLSLHKGFCSLSRWDIKTNSITKILRRTLFLFHKLIAFLLVWWQLHCGWFNIRESNVRELTGILRIFVYIFIPLYALYSSFSQKKKTLHRLCVHRSLFTAKWFALDWNTPSKSGQCFYIELFFIGNTQQTAWFFLLLFILHFETSLGLFRLFSTEFCCCFFV